MIPLALTAALAVASSAASLACKKTEEPVSREAGVSASGSPQAYDADAAAKEAADRRNRRTRLNQESCTIAAKHINVLHGRHETDPKGTLVLSQCLNSGNLAWYGCIMEAKTTEAISECNRTLLIVTSPR